MEIHGRLCRQFMDSLHRCRSVQVLLQLHQSLLQQVLDVCLLNDTVAIVLLGQMLDLVTSLRSRTLHSSTSTLTTVMEMKREFDQQFETLLLCLAGIIHDEPEREHVERLTDRLQL
jgi:hypothetical protein